MQPNLSPENPVVLVVDDAPSSLGVLVETLESAGYTVLVASDGQTALERLERITPDAILLDCVMPGLSGFDTCRRIKNNAAWAQIPVIFMTGLSDTQHVVEGFACGGVDYVVKPLRAAEVLARLHTHASNAQVNRMVRDALDVAGLGVVLVDGLGRIAWRSPRAARALFSLHDGGVDFAATKLQQALQAVLQSSSASVECKDTTPRMSLRNMGQTSTGETLVLLETERAVSALESRLKHAALTARETEVLSWIAKGKTNRDIAEILSLSHRTVNKHLEHIYQKLGVETRAAAAAVAMG
jgi:DNA-binding response OmpR family regulator